MTSHGLVIATLGPVIALEPGVLAEPALLSPRPAPASQRAARGSPTLLGREPLGSSSLTYNPGRWNVGPDVYIYIYIYTQPF